MDNKSRDLELEKQIDAYIKGNLSEKQGQVLWQDLLKKPEYIDYLNIELAAKSIYDENINYDDNINSAASTAANKEGATEGVDQARQGSWKWIAAAAAVILLVVATYILQLDTSQNLQKSAIKEINIVENLISVQVVRSEAANLSGADSLLNVGFSVAIAGKKRQAIKIYHQIVENFSNQPAAKQAYYNKGIIQYNAGDLAGAAASFRAVVSGTTDHLSNAVQEKTYWYMGNAYLKMEKFKQARKAVYKVETMGGDYQNKAQQLLLKIDRRLDKTGDTMDEQLKE